ncbi:hypothetical protein CHS0354_025463 [Potamilus streckersoni]|uniref:Sushi domain-containing protein n=1 Tax=Potamilus streckersoni TaxID=2493646 RepID=A0AAE0RRM5_9BIVA|nr:hypothetical protein CHS0354_025463 [Potamilus streckersoni]
MTECPKLTNRTGEFITASTVSDLSVSTYNLTVGTAVNVSCSTSLGYYLTGDNTFTCQSNGQWSYRSAPKCQLLKSTSAPGSNDLSNESKILIGVVVPVAAIVIIVLIILIVCVCRAKRSHEYKDRIHPRKEYPVPLSNYSQREYESRPYVIESDIHKDYTTSVTRFQPPPYRYRYPDYFESSQTPAAYRTREFRTIPANDYSHMSERMEPIRSPDMYDTPYLSEPGGRVTKKPYVGEWVSRSTSGDLDLDEFNSDALRHGRDPLLWRNSYSNWGHEERIASRPELK